MFCLAAPPSSFATRAAAAFSNSFSEDPLLTGRMAGAAIDGAQSRHLISTIKHFALNDQETDRVVLDARIDRAALRESDLLAFEIGIEQGRPGSLMCAYNQVNGSMPAKTAGC
jgi:beta-glucosidase